MDSGDNFVPIEMNKDQIFNKYQQSNGSMDIASFQDLVRCIFNTSSEPSPQLEEIIKSQVPDLFKIFDQDQDNVISSDEFNWMWTNWIETIVKPRSALLVIDVQNDFISGSLAIGRCPAGLRGEQVVPVINKLIDRVPFDTVVYSYDWHPEDHISFVENASLDKIEAINGELISKDRKTTKDFKVFDQVTFDLGSAGKRDQILWPKHCVQGTWGSELHPNLKVRPDCVKIYKGTDSNIDSYSAFGNSHGTKQLHGELKDRGITDVYVCGIAYDFCVLHTARDANRLGYRTILVEDASRGTDEKLISSARLELQEKHCLIVDSDKVAAMVRGDDRPFEFALFSAFKLAESLAAGTSPEILD